MCVVKCCNHLYGLCGTYKTVARVCVCVCVKRCRGSNPQKYCGTIPTLAGCWDSISKYSFCDFFLLFLEKGRKKLAMDGYHLMRSCQVHMYEWHPS